MEYPQGYLDRYFALNEQLWHGDWLAAYRTAESLALDHPHFHGSWVGLYLSSTFLELRGTAQKALAELPQTVDYDTEAVAEHLSSIAQRVLREGHDDIYNLPHVFSVLRRLAVDHPHYLAALSVYEAEHLYAIGNYGAAYKKHAEASDLLDALEREADPITEWQNDLSWLRTTTMADRSWQEKFGLVRRITQNPQYKEYRRLRHHLVWLLLISGRLGSKLLGRVFRPL